MTDIEKGWVAGIIDGEGCIGIYRNSVGGRSASHTLRVSVSNTDKPMMLELQRLCGGRIRPATGKRKPRWRPSWLWDLSGYEALAFLAWVTPGLIAKREQGELASQFVLVGKTARRTESQKADMEALRVRLRAYKSHRQEAA